MIYLKTLAKACQFGLMLPFMLVITGCGQPGPLYLPAKTQPAPVPVETQTKPQTQPEIKKDH